MKSNMLLVFSVVLIVAGIISMAFFFNPTGRKMTLTGHFVSMSDCTGVVQGTRIMDYGNSDTMCQNSGRYDGQVINITGYVYDMDCEGEEGCFMGPRMEDVESIEIVE